MLFCNMLDSIYIYLHWLGGEIPCYFAIFWIIYKCIYIGGKVGYHAILQVVGPCLYSHYM